MASNATAHTRPSTTGTTPDQPEWLEVTIRTPIADAERLGTLLVDAGSQGVVTGTRELAHGDRRRAYETVRGFFRADDPVRARLAVEAILNELRTTGAGARPRRRTAGAVPASARGNARRATRKVPPKARTARTASRPVPLKARWLALDERLWGMDWRQHFKAIAVGASLVIVPPWDRQSYPGRRRIVVHPGMAFGTGQHVTTHACLEAIEELASPPPRHALDVGTGTGILAIALAKLGVAHVHAIDIDPHAVAAARENVRRNRAGRRVRISARPLPITTGDKGVTRRQHYPLVVANLYVDALLSLETTLADRVAPGGRLVTSGILRTRQRRLRAAFAPERWRLVRARRCGSWVTSIFERHDTTGAPKGTRPAPRPQHGRGAKRSGAANHSATARHAGTARRGNTARHAGTARRGNTARHAR